MTLLISGHQRRRHVALQHVDGAVHVVQRPGVKVVDRGEVEVQLQSAEGRGEGGSGQTDWEVEGGGEVEEGGDGNGGGGQHSHLVAQTSCQLNKPGGGLICN